MTHLLNQLKNTFSFSSEEKIDEKKLAQKYRKEVKESLHIHDLKKKMLEYFADDQQMAKFYQLYQGSGATLQFRIDFTGKDQNRKLEDYQKNDPVFFKLLLSYPKLNEEDKATLNTGKPFTVEITVLTREESKSKPSVNEESEEHKSDIACAAPAPPGPTGPANRSPSLENNPRYLSNAEYSPAYSDIW
ncbi:hypothetical protein [Endozoicomonas sp.]|uniref:hypothetical protein n=1 Tax=Endozoicomonas sp. TaxID=1892382 RepID=UPI0028844447|nr:hypothetical protein [Endozoicomonas sp.]